MGIALLFDNNFETLINFQDKNWGNGNFVRYGLQTFSITNTFGVRVFESVNVGGGFIHTTTSQTELKQHVDIFGNTSREEIGLTAKPIFVPLVGVQYDRPDFRVGAVYRGESISRVDPSQADTTVEVAGTQLSRYETRLKFADAFFPQNAALGLEVFPKGSLAVTLHGEWQNWSHFEDEIKVGDQARKGHDIRTRDVYVPRFGLAYRVWDVSEFRAGSSYEQTPFVRVGNGDNLILDNDRVRFALGFGTEIFRDTIFSKQVFLDLAALWIHLLPRKEETKDKITVHSWGDLVGGTASISFGF